MIDWNVLMEIIEWKFIYILLDLTQNSCEKCNFRSLALELNLSPCDSSAVLQPTEVHRSVNVKL
jgi:hypothetical protein